MTKLTSDTNPKASVAVDEEWLTQALAESLSKPLSHLVNIEHPLDFEGYIKAGGYIGATKALKELTPKEVLDLVNDSGLKGRGGAGFPTGMKWSCVPALQGGEKLPDNSGARQNQQNSYLICNGDEMELVPLKIAIYLKVCHSS